MSFFDDLDQMGRRTYAVGHALNEFERARRGLLAATNAPLPPPVPPAPAPLDARSIDETIDSFDADAVPPPPAGPEESELAAAIRAVKQHRAAPAQYEPPPLEPWPRPDDVPPIARRFAPPPGGHVVVDGYGEGR